MVDGRMILLFDNGERLHAALDYLTPAAMYAAARAGV